MISPLCFPGCWAYFSAVSHQLAMCDLCSAVLKTNDGSTSGLIRHLRAKHLIYDLSIPRLQLPQASGESDVTADLVFKF